MLFPWNYYRYTMVRCFSHTTTFLKLDLKFFLRLPVPRPGQVLGLVGTNGIGKSTALKILAGKVKPNLGKFTVSNTEQALFVILFNGSNCRLWNYLLCLQDPPNWDEILRNFRGSELQKYFTRLLEDKMKVHYRIYQKISPTDVKLQCSVFWCIYGYYLFPHLTYHLSIINIWLNLECVRWNSNIVGMQM